MGNAITSVNVGAAAEELIITPSIEAPLIRDLFMDIKTVKKITKLYFTPTLEDITYTKTGCGWSFATGDAVTDKTLTQVEWATAIEQCYKVFKDTYFANGLPEGVEVGELSPEVLDILTGMMTGTISNDFIRKLFLSDVTSGQPFYNSMNGVYKKLTSDSDVPDAGAITDANIVATDGSIEVTLNRVFQAQDYLMKGLPAGQKVFYVTGSVYDAYLRYLQLKTGITAIVQRQQIEQGIYEAPYNNIQMVPLYTIDAALAKSFVTGSPDVIENPHRIILTVKGNHAIRIDNESYTDTKAWYSQDDNVYRIAGSAQIAYDFKLAKYNVIAGF